jgi:hypothetical protein
MSRLEYQHYDFYVESELHEVKSMFKMTDPTIKQCLINIKHIREFKFNELPEGDLRFLEVPVHFRESGKGWRKHFIQYNTKSGKYRIIIGVPNDQAGNTPSESEMTKIPPNRCPIYTESDIHKRKIFDYAETMIKDDALWEQLKDLHTRIENLPKLLPNFDPSAEIPSVSKTKYLKYKTKYINYRKRSYCYKFIICNKIKIIFYYFYIMFNN